MTDHRDTKIDFTQKRENLIRKTIERRGIDDPAVLKAMRTVRREEFIPADLRDRAYEDYPLPIGNDQTISQPYIVALMTTSLELQPEDRVLEIGTGSGYAAAVLGCIAKEVHTVERYPTLAQKAAVRLKKEGFDNVHVRHGDGTKGWPEKSPFDAIVVTAAGPELPLALLDQLRIGGRLVIPVGPNLGPQELIRLRKTGLEGYEKEVLCSVQFVPLIDSKVQAKPD